MIRTLQAAIHPYHLHENIEAIEEDLEMMERRDPDAPSMVDLTKLNSSLAAYQTQVDMMHEMTERKKPTVDVDKLNETMREAALVLNPKMFDRGCTAWIPGQRAWASSTTCQTTFST